MYAAVRRVTGCLPAALTQRIYLECRLHELEPLVDVVFCVDDKSREHLLEPHRDWLDPSLRNHPLWKGLERLCSEWANRQSELHELIYDIWLEFDAGERSIGLEALVPSVFVGFTSHLDLPRSTLWMAGREALELLSGGPIPRAVRRTAERCVRALPDGANLLYVGNMFPRDSTAIRLCVSPLEGAALCGYLDRIAWPGSVDVVNAGLATVAEAARQPRTALLHVDVRDAVQPRIGIEVPLDQRAQLHGRLAESALLERLCNANLCTATKRDALLAWPGHSREMFPHQLWPSLALRRVSHVKLVTDGARKLSAKAYLSIFHGPASSPRTAPDANASPRLTR
jgi:hypothetical protein